MKEIIEEIWVKNCQTNISWKNSSAQNLKGLKNKV